MEAIGVVGAGAMGAGIAQVAAVAGYHVLLFDLDRAAAERAREGIRGRLARLVEKGQIDQAAADAALGRVRVAAALEDFAGADCVIEAIVERLEPKQDLFAALEAIVAPETILATNTSSLSVAAIGARCRRQERVCGLHFFNPVPLMKLVEVIKAPATSEETMARAVQMSERLGKTPVRVADGPGFLVNLAGRAYVTEALHIVEERVADVATVDRIMRDGAGFRMGPFELMDLTGIDVNFPATRFIHQGYHFDPRLKTTTLHESLFNAGRFGRKTGQGYHSYGAVEPATPEPAPAVASARIAARIVAEDAAQWDALRQCGIDDGDDLILIAPVGEDAAGACHRLGLDPERTVAIDFTGADHRHFTLMSAIGGSHARAEVARWMRGRGLRVEEIGDSPGFVLQRIIAMIANLGCELAQIGVGSPDDIDLAMRLAQNYPKGPLEWADHLGAERTFEILRGIQAATGSDRYRPSLWLRRRALLGLCVHQAD